MQRLLKAIALLIAGTVTATAFAEDGAEHLRAYHAQAIAEQAKPYRYGDDLDISRVLSRTDVSGQCGIVPTRLDYEDSQGQQHTLEYLVWGSGCNGG